MKKLNQYNSPDCYLFFSYAHKDSKVANKLVNKLQEKGYPVWFDKNNLRYGTNFHKEISDGIVNSKVFISLISKNYNTEYCERERALGMEKVKNRLGVFIDKSTDYNDINLQFNYAGRNMIGYGEEIVSDEDIEQLAEEIISSPLLNEVKRLLGKVDKSTLLLNDSTLEYLNNLLHREYKSSGNYYIEQLIPELFSDAVELDNEINKIYKKKDKDHIPFLEIIEKSKRLDNFLITGEGGIGKTASLIQLCEDNIINKGIPTIYISLNRIDFQHETIFEYIKKRLENQVGLWGKIETIVKFDPELLSNKDQKVVLLLDGFNETPLKYHANIIKQLNDIFEQWRNAQVFISSRYDFRETNFFLKSLRHIKLEEQKEDYVESFLLDNDIKIPEDRNLLKVLRTPLLLTLYTGTEKHRENIDNRFDIELIELPTNSGQILWNFFQTQLYRAVVSTTNVYDRLFYFVILYFILPYLSLELLNNDQLELSDRDFFNILNNTKFRNLFEEYKNSYAFYELKGKIEGAFYEDVRLDIGYIKEILLKTLRFFYLTDSESKRENKFHYLHQDFRDYFAAYFISEQIKQINELQLNDFVNYSWSILTDQEYPKEILKFTSEILNESAASPEFINNDWIFPGKPNNSIGPSELSLSENALTYLKGKEGQKAQIAVKNLIEILSIGRSNKLANCDFSFLDLRKCSLNNYLFSEWYKDKNYSSSFSNSIINFENFINLGHNDYIGALATDKKRLLFSGDNIGTLIIWDLNNENIIQRLQIKNSRIIDLCFNEELNTLAILTPKQIFTYNLSNKELRELRKEVYKDFYYIKYVDNKIYFSYSHAPLIWLSAEDNSYLNQEYFHKDIPVKNAKFNPTRKQFLRSFMGKTLEITNFNDESSTWVSTKVNNYHSKFDEYQGRRINAIEYSDNGETFIVAFGSNVLEFSSDTLEILRDFSLNTGIINSLKYGKDNSIIIATKSNITIISKDQSELLFLEGVKTMTGWSYLSIDNRNFIASNQLIKEIDNNARVIQIRRISTEYKVRNITYNIITKKPSFIIQSKSTKDFYQYDFDEDIISEFNPNSLIKKDDNNSDSHLSLVGSRLISTKKSFPYTQNYLENYHGINIVKCDFSNIKSDSNLSDFKYFLFQNGGTI